MVLSSMYFDAYPKHNCFRIMKAVLYFKTCLGILTSGLTTMFFFDRWLLALLIDLALSPVGGLHALVISIL